MNPGYPQHPGCSKAAGVLDRAILLAACLALLGSGCGGPERESPSSVSTPPPQSRPVRTDAAAAAPGASTDNGHPADVSSADPRSRTKWLGDIPYDVFYDEPLVIAADDRLVSTPDRDEAAVAPAVPRPAEEPASQPASRTETVSGAASAATSSVDWRPLAEIEVINEEVKQLRNRLTGNLRTVATFNRGLDMVANDAVVLAALACVVAEHPQPLSWKPHAPAVRDLAAELAGHATRTGREAFSAAQAVLEQLLVILDGGLPPNSNPAAPLPPGEVAERSELMKRIKRSFDWLKSEITSEARLQGDQEQALREATLLALLGGLVSTDSYDYADEPQYGQFVREFIEGSVGMTAAVRAEDFPGFLSSRDRVQHSCGQCHAQYALGDEGL